MSDKGRGTDLAVAGANRNAAVIGAALGAGRFEAVCRDSQGREKWRDSIKNLIVNAGLNYLLDAGLSGATPITSWYLGLTATAPTAAAGDTAGSHGGWTEVTAYDEAARQAWTEGGVSSQAITNSGSPAVFTISTNSTVVGGLFLISVNTKGGSTGTLFAVGAFSAGDKSLDDGDTITVTYTASLSAS